jgi:uncharacterized protein YdcH (DUF465 family)
MKDAIATSLLQSGPGTRIRTFFRSFDLPQGAPPGDAAMSPHNGGNTYMSHVPHELHEEFPDQTEALHSLKLGNAHFARLADEYHEVNREVHRAETDVSPVSDEALEEMKKKRLALKDQIAALLAAA